MNMMFFDFNKVGVWSSFLGVCRIYNNLEIGEIVVQNFVWFELDVVSYYVLFVNIYLLVGFWEKVIEVRRKMREKGVRKEFGCSWIEYGDEVYKFIVGDLFYL